ncbi:hypothetical protein [Iodidimonas sp. SYSU 1G8]|uniref:hypothetical protein n=1 Tax=Iodidimonas sp. SYSU 1G8 TaxID=3133967 RepID=UPI0031FEECB0
MEFKCILDFDGVLFDTAFEAYSVCSQHAKANTALRGDVSFEEFLVFRSMVTDAWQYNQLYNPAKRPNAIADLRTIVPDGEDWEFSRAFFAAREEIMAEPDWPKIMSPYEFFFLMRPLLQRYPQHFAILSTRNVDSIRGTLRYFDAGDVEIFGQEDVRRYGSKVAVAKQAGWLQAESCFCVYVDDMRAHLEPFNGLTHLALHANWGYDEGGPDSMNADQIFSIISSLTKVMIDQLSGAVDA